MTYLIAAIIELCGILFAIHVVMNSRTSQGAIAWLLSLICLPFIAIPAYLVFGRAKFSGVVEAYSQRQEEIDELRGEVHTAMVPWFAEATARPDMHSAMHQLVGTQLTGHNQATLLIDGEQTFDSIIEGITQARDYVLVQFYMIHNDGLGQRLQRTLISMATAGVRVYVLYDEIGSLGLPSYYLDALRGAGIQVSAFRPQRGYRNRFQLNFRNHRKMVVVDGVQGWVGGHNVGDEYLGLDPKLSPWRDTHVKLEGPVVTQLQSVILTDWYWATRELPPLNWQPQAATDGNMKAMILPFSPDHRLESAGLFFVAALQSARHRIWLSAPYFVPDEAVMKALELASLRGVDVRIITTGIGDSLPVFLAAFHYIEQLRGLGIRFYAYGPGFLHEKVMLVDDEISSVGTANYDNRSFRLNFEVTALIIDPDFAAQMTTMFERDFEQSTAIDVEALERKPWYWWFGVKLCRLASPLL